MHSRAHQHNTSNRRRGWAGFRRFARDEEGAAYTLSYVMVIPIYALLICLIIEAALILTAKLGTVYAAYAAARTASVWSSHTTWEKTMEKAKRAALKTMVPFASGTQDSLDLDQIPTDQDTAGRRHRPMWVAYNAYAAKPESNKYVAAKYAYASRNVEVEIEGPPEKSDTPITAKVTYHFPVQHPRHRPHPRRQGTGRLFLQHFLHRDDPQRRPAGQPQDDWNRLWNARINSPRGGRADSRARRATRHGKITLVTLIAILGMMVIVGFVGNAGYVVTEKMNTQNAADAVAFSSAQWMARGMNAVTATNHLLGEVTALVVVIEGLGGPEADVGMEAYPPQSRITDSINQNFVNLAKINGLPVYGTTAAGKIDGKFLDVVVNKFVSKKDTKHKAWATIYDSKLVLKKSTAKRLIVKSIANGWSVGAAAVGLDVGHWRPTRSTSR